MAEDLDTRVSMKTEFIIADAMNDSRGYAVVVRRQQRTLWVTSLWVHPEQRQQGYAAALLRAVVSEFGDEPLYLEVAPYSDRPLDAAALEALYARFDFRMTSVPGIMCRCAGAAHG
jgi:ribosomal protein S18 acetylase RimI-like enzyme